MAVRFVIGRAGSGKTHRGFHAIVQAMRDDPLGPPIYWLVPRQATFTAERELTCLSGLPAFCRAKVVSFEELANDIAESCGGSAIPPITAQGRRMILGHLLRQNREKLEFFSNVARQPGLAAELDNTFAELERSGKSIDDIAVLIDELSESNAADLELAPLLKKLRDTKLLYDAYANYLGQGRLDQHRRSIEIREATATCPTLAHAAIYVDGFVDFTEHERLMLVGVARAGANLEICLRIDPHSPVLANPHHLPDEMSLFRRTEETYRRLYFAFTEAGISIEPSVRLEKVRRFSAPALARLEESLFRDPIEPANDASGIELIETPDDRAEVDAVAREIRALLKSGLRLRDIAVLVRSLDSYHERIDAAFREHGIPYFADRRRAASQHPLLQFVRSIFQIGRQDWPHDAAMTLLRTGLAGISLYDADGLENYVLEHHVRGSAGWESPQPWKFRRNLTLAEDVESYDPASPENAETLRRRLVEKLLPLTSILRGEQEIEVRQLAAAIFQTLERFSVRQTLAAWSKASADAGRLEQSAEHELVWTRLCELFDEMVDLLGDERLSPAEFQDVMEAGLESFDLALTPPTLDQVLVGQVDRTRTPALKAVFVLGMNEGQFPRVAGESTILSDRDRHSLRTRRIELDPGQQQRLLDERFLGYVAMTRASHHLFITRPLSDAGDRATEPSVFWRRIVELFPSAKTTRVAPDHAGDPSRISTPRQLVSSLMQWVRTAPDGPTISLPRYSGGGLGWGQSPSAIPNDPHPKPSPGVPGEGVGAVASAEPIKADALPPNVEFNAVWLSLYQWFSQKESKDDAIDHLRQRAWPALLYSNSAQLGSERIPQLFSSPLDASVAQLETFAACPFRHFARHTLGLRDRAAQQVTSHDLGRLYHDILETALQHVLNRRAEGDKTITLESAADQFLQKLAGVIRGELMLGSARNRYLLDRVGRTLQQIAQSQREFLKRGHFRPQHVGVTFGQRAKLPPLVIQTPGGAEAHLRGKIDRVDRVTGSDDVAVIDYRTHKTSLSLGMVHHGLMLQLLSYLLVLEANGQKWSGKHFDPAAAFYLQLVRKIEAVKHPREAKEVSDPKWHLKLRPRGRFDRRCLSALDKDLTTGSSEVVQAYITTKGDLGFRNRSDVAESQEFRELLKQVGQKLGELADGVLSGNIDISPYRLKNKSPCPGCTYRSVCRFDPAINRYRYLEDASSAPRPGDADA